MGEKRVPLRRNYLKEAYKIAKGDKMPARKEHVKAAIEAVEFFHKQTDGLRKLMDQAYQEACKRRKENGLPPPVKPPVLDKGPDLE